MSKKILVIKLGSAVISNAMGNISALVIKKLAGEVNSLMSSYNIVLVSSGAVSSGKVFLQNYKGTLKERKAAAAIGNPILIQKYQSFFKPFGITVAQALCERKHFSDREQFLQLKQTFATLWNSQILPIVNENDVVSNFELKFSDNDELATLMAIGFDAELLIICTSVGGLLNDEKKIIPIINKLDATTLNYVTKDKSATGLGGMVSKLTFTKLATSLGIGVIFCGINAKNSILAAIQKKCGSYFVPQKPNLKARQKWLASGSITLGNIQVDKGAENALRSRKSLLSIGILAVTGNFDQGEVIQISDDGGVIIGVAKAKNSALQITENRGTKNFVAAHADDIVLL